MTTKFVSSYLHGSDAVPLTRQILITQGIDAEGNTDVSIANLDDLAMPISIAAAETASNGVLRMNGGSVSEVVKSIASCKKLPTPLSKQKKGDVYSDSRSIEKDCEIVLQNYFLSKKARIVEDSIDQDGWTTVRTGLKPAADTPPTAQEVSNLPDFYKFQVKERKLKEWQSQKNRNNAAQSEVLEMAKRRRFQL
jgi:hypothetical protein